jgi:hypothetical protein
LLIVGLKGKNPKHLPWRDLKMKSEFIERMVDQALIKGTVEADCMECDMAIECSTDAKRAWCDNCEKTVDIKNPLITMGFM